MSDGSSGRATRPARAAVLRMRVHDARPVGPGFMRVTLAADAADRDALEPMGFDQWFRMFLPEGGELVLPHGDMDGWYARWLAIPEPQRPAVRNYTVRELRAEGDRWMLDVDLVVHRGADGSVDGRAAAWALDARPGDEVGILDQGRIFQQPDAGRPIVIVADESGLPGVEGILRDLAPGHAVTACIEVPSTADVRPLPSASDVDVRWSVRELGARSRLADLVDGLDLPADAVAYVVGEHAAVLAARARLRARGMHKDAIDFCAYWRVGRR